MPSTIFEAWQSGIITEEQYNTLLSNGAFPNTIWTPGALDAPLTSATLTVVKIVELTGTKTQSIVIKNTGSTHSLKFLIEYYVDDIIIFTFADTVGPMGIWRNTTQHAVSCVVVKVQDASPGDHTSYSVGVMAA